MPSSSAPPARSARPQLETLEDRCLPSSTAYVTALYNDFLHRTPAAAEVSGWVAALNAGVSPTQVALDFTQSAEYLTNLIHTDYKFFLGRQPSAAEAAGWLAQLQAGLSEQQLQAAFLGSGEFFARHGNANAPWLDAVYQTTLGRPVDASGLAFWQQRLNQGMPRDQVALDIVGSSEALTRLVTSAYNTLLGRDPDPAGLAFWVGRLEQGLMPSQFLAQIASSDEFIAIQGGLDTVVVPVIEPVFVPVDTFFDPFLFPVGVGVLGCGCTTAGFGGGLTGGFTGGGFTGGFAGGTGSGTF